MSNISKRRREGSRTKIKSMGDHRDFLSRITKTLYYGQLPTLPCLSLPVTEISCELWSVPQRGRSVRRLHADAAASIARSACVSPCALVLAILYLERLNSCNPDYIAAAAPADLFLVSLMVGNKFLQDDGEDDDVMCSEWAASGGLELKQLKKLEVEFLNAIDWNVFVSNKSFEAGLSWLERQVALRQAQVRGFFTYGDLAAACEGDTVAGAARGVAPALAACLAALAACLTALAACLTALAACLTALTALPAMQYLLPALNAIGTNVITHSLQRPPIHYVSNATTHISTLDILGEGEDPVPDSLKCCSKWSKYRDSTTTKRNWYDTIVLSEWKSPEPWWSTTSVLTWLYQRSLVNPMQRWLDKVQQYAGLVSAAGCGGAGVRCHNLSRAADR